MHRGLKCFTLVSMHNHPLLQHVDFEKRKTCSFESIQYFLTRFSEVLTSEHTDEINGEFRLYQSLPAIPEELDTSQIYEEDHFRADILWHELQEVKDVNGKEKLGLR